MDKQACKHLANYKTTENIVWSPICFSLSIVVLVTDQSGSSKMITIYQIPYICTTFNLEHGMKLSFWLQH